MLFAAAIAVPPLALRFFGLHSVTAFWAAYVLTRPLGASLADWFGKPGSQGNDLSFGDGTVAAATLAVSTLLVGYVAIRRGLSLPIPR